MPDNLPPIPPPQPPDPSSGKIARPKLACALLGLLLFFGSGALSLIIPFAFIIGIFIALIALAVC